MAANLTGTGRNEGMPELPEVETARRLIAGEALRRRIADGDDSDTFGPDAAEVTAAEFRDLITRGSVAVKARLLD